VTRAWWVFGLTIVVGVVWTLIAQRLSRTVRHREHLLAGDLRCPCGGKGQSTIYDAPDGRRFVDCDRCLGLIEVPS
jgi:hypothetical protein